MRTLRDVVLVGLACVGVVLTACSSARAPEPEPVGCQPYAAPSGSDLTTPQTSLRRDVLPILVASCGATSCHGSNDLTRNQGIFLGNDGTAMRQTALQNTRELPKMPFVMPGDPSKSFLLHKIDGDQCTLDAQCVLGTCGDRMPQQGPPLSTEQRDTVRRWIAQGALDD